MNSKVNTFVKYIFGWVFTIVLAYSSIFLTIHLYKHGNNLQGNLVIGYAMGLMTAVALFGVVTLITPIVKWLWAKFLREHPGK